MLGIIFLVIWGGCCAQTRGGLAQASPDRANPLPRNPTNNLAETQAVVVAVRLVKAQQGSQDLNWSVRLPGSCPSCRVVNGPFNAKFGWSCHKGENPLELFFCVSVPASVRSLRGVMVTIGDHPIRTIIVGQKHIPFTVQDQRVQFDVPVAIPPSARSSTMDLHTVLQSPGLEIRIEHAFRERRAGEYASGSWRGIELQRQAALNLEFGLREAIRTLGLDQEVARKKLGCIHLMGFDTNDPLGHKDYPPHIHIILRWPHFAGSQAPHIYISKKGLLLPSVIVTIDGMPDITPTHISSGNWLPAIDYLGGTVFETLITGDGGLTLRRSNSRSCMLKPLKKSDEGFASGTVVSCSSGQVFRVRADDSTSQGRLRVQVNSRSPEIYRYDPDTGSLLNTDPELTGSLRR